MLWAVRSQQTLSLYMFTSVKIGGNAWLQTHNVTLRRLRLTSTGTPLTR